MTHHLREGDVPPDDVVELVRQLDRSTAVPMIDPDREAALMAAFDAARVHEDGRAKAPPSLRFGVQACAISIVVIAPRSGAWLALAAAIVLAVGGAAWLREPQSAAAVEPHRPLRQLNLETSSVARGVGPAIRERAAIHSGSSSVDAAVAGVTAGVQRRRRARRRLTVRTTAGRCAFCRLGIEARTHHENSVDVLTIACAAASVGARMRTSWRREARDLRHAASATAAAASASRRHDARAARVSRQARPTRLRPDRCIKRCRTATASSIA
jgi:hypothetical protein